MSNIVALGPSCQQFSRAVITDAGKHDERAWLAKSVERSILKGREFSRFCRPASARLCRTRLAFESVRLRRAFRAGEKILCFDADRAVQAWRHIVIGSGTPQYRDGMRLMEANDVWASLADIRDWLLALSEDDPRLHRKLAKITLEQAAVHAHRWHRQMEARAAEQAREEERRRTEEERRRGERIAELRAANRGALDIEEPGFWINRHRPSAAVDTEDAEARRSRVAEIIAAPVDDTPRPLVPRAADEITVLRVGSLDWVQLLTPAALDRESKRMHHCVGGGGYDDGVTSGETWILSLRTEDDEPLVTVEYTPVRRVLRQAKGSGNRAAPDGALAALAALLRHLQPTSADIYDLRRVCLRWVPPSEGRPGSVEAVNPTASPSPFTPFFDETLLNINFAPPGRGLGMYFQYEMMLGMLNDQNSAVHTLNRRRSAEVSQADNLSVQASAERGKRPRSYPWSRRRRPTLDMLRAIANNPAADAEDRQEAKARMREMMMPGVSA